MKQKFRGQRLGAYLSLIGFDIYLRLNLSRASSPQINSYTEPKDVEFTYEAPVTKSGSTLTYGPYNNIPASASKEFVTSKQQRVNVYYKHNAPVMEITKMVRAAEVSHWGANINIQDDIWLHNAGPE